MTNSKQFSVSHIPFVRMCKSGLDAWEKMKEGEYRELRAVPATFIDIHSLKEKAEELKRSDRISKYEYYCAGSIWESTVGFMSPSWVNKYRVKKEFDYRFGTGIYCEMNELLFIDDVFEWAHRRIESKQVRSAFDIIVQIAKGKLKL